MRLWRRMLGLMGEWLCVFCGVDVDVDVDLWLCGWRWEGEGEAAKVVR